jgi:hypothetical protein
MIEVDYRHFGFLKAKQIFYGDSLPSCEGYDFIYCKNYYVDLPLYRPFSRIECKTIIIDLTRDSEVLFKQVHKQRRKRIRQGLEKGYRITSQKPTPDILKEFQRLYERFIVPRGSPAFLTWHAITSLVSYMTAFIGELDDIIYEIKILVHDGRAVRAHWVARNLDHPRFKDCNDMHSLMQWEAIMHFQRLGYHIYDLGGVRLDPADPLYAIGQYKRSFGGEIVPTYWYQAMISPLARILDSGRTFFRRLKSNLRHVGD